MLLIQQVFQFEGTGTKYVLYVNGSSSSATKEKLWQIYNQIDPDMRAADLVLDIEADGSGTR
jgi:hypothetical protein